MRKLNRKSVKLLAAATLVVAVDARLWAADTGSYITISTSGSTAIRNWLTATGFTALEAGAADLTLSNGVYSPGATGLQLAPSSTGGVLPGSTGPGIRFDWHEQGSVEGILEMANDQIGYAGGVGGTPIVDTAVPRFPTTANPIRINRNVNGSGGGSAGGYSIAGADVYNTYSATNYNQLTGSNLLGGENRVQLAFADVVANQGFSKPGTAGYNLTPTTAGYGKGNPLLVNNSVSGTGTAGGRQQLYDQSVLNMTTSMENPGAPTTGDLHNTYATGTWNTANAGNIVSTPAVMTATVFAANPGTGLTQLNKGDAQWLQLTGRFQNGIDFNFAQRDVNSGTRNVAANNSGVNPSWAVGDNDGGNGNSPATGVGSANDQASIGQYMKFSGKTAGGAQLRPTVENNRMAIGPLSLPDARSGSAASSSSSNFPIRALSYSNTATDSGANFVQVSAATITDGSYAIWQQETFNTVRDPANYNNPNAIKGDPNGDVAKIRNLITNSVTNFPNPTSILDPADAAVSNGFILPQMMTVTKDYDGGATAFVGGVTVNGMTHTQWRQALIDNAASSFAVQAPINQTAGNSSLYGVAPVNGGNSALATGALNIPITAQNAAGATDTSAGAVGGNYLFGNFNQTGVRDFSAVKSAVAAQAALFAAGGAAAVDVNNLGVSNSTRVTGISTALDHMNGSTGPSKGDLVVLGDFNGDGKFDGKDLYYMARGAAVSDASGSGFTNGTLNATNLNFGDKVRSAQLRKNAALDYMQTNATAQQKIDASANLINDPTGVNAFKKTDVNRDGLITRSDAQVVDHFIGSSYKNLNDQVNAVVARENGTVLDGQDINGGTAIETAAPISLVDVELNDSSDGGITESDFSIIRNDLGSSKLLDGDANFDGRVDILDLYALAVNFNSPVDRWSKGDFDLNGKVDAHDLGLLGLNWRQSAAALGEDLQSLGLPPSAIPEPACLGLIPLGFVLARRRNRAR